MFNRILTVLSSIHAKRIIHGAVIPTHLLIEPDIHGLKLVDWCWSSEPGKPVYAFADAWKNLCPPEMTPGGLLSPATDIYMAARCMTYVLGQGMTDILPTTLHPKFRRLLEACMLKNPARRPQDAWKLYEQFGEISKEVFGPRKFVKLTLETQEV